jgi:CelD/BcsL family acetyltransferase involved in cellulose biosynthesis
MSGQGWLRFDVLLLDGRPLAFHFGFEYRNRFFWYKPTFDTAWAGYSPGEVMLKFLLQDAIDRELSEFDFTVGDEPYKYRFCNEIRENRQIVAYSSALDYWVSRGSLICKRLKTHIRTRFGRGSG